MFKKRFAALMLSCTMLLSAAACGSNETTSGSVTAAPAEAKHAEQAAEPAKNPAEEQNPADLPNDSVLVIGVTANFEEKWNPFIVESAYDHEAVDRIFTPICELNVRGELVPLGGNISAEQSGEIVTYTIKINEGMFFSDGVPVTIDDYIYGLYVRADPSFAGKPGNLLDSHIDGVENYFYDDPNYEEAIKKIEADCEAAYSVDNISLEDFLVYAKATNLDGGWDGDLTDGGDIGNGTTWAQYVTDEGFGEKLAGIDASSPEAMLALVSEVEYVNYKDSYEDVLLWFTEKLKSEYALGNLSEGITVPEITGIKKVDDLTCTVQVNRVGIYDDRGFTANNGSGNLIPKHYYGEYPKGDVSSVLANMKPLGSGPYIWDGFEDNIVTAHANVNYFEGVPKTGIVRWQFLPESEIINALASGAIDIGNPNGTPPNIQSLKDMQVEYDLVMNAGYGYMAMNTTRVPLDVRRGLWSLMNREPSVLGYYGADSGLAQIIQRPMTTTLAEYPVDAKETYPYSREKALEYFKAAGYTQDAGGKLVDEKGNQLKTQVYISAQGSGDHPAYAMLVQASDDLAALGGELQVEDVDFNVLQGAMNNGTADAWVMAWGSTYECDKSTQFRSTGGQNRYKFSDPKMDKLLDDIVQTLDLTKRRALVAEMLDLAMDQCIEYPLYQRKNLIAYNKNNVAMDSIPESSATFDYKNVLWKVEVIGQ